MGKKKRGAAADEVSGPDPRIVELGSIIAKEVKKREREERRAKQTLLPLKRVNSGPIIYEFVPMSRSLYSNSKSVDFGFDGVVDIPNQVVYMEEVPDDALDKTSLSIPEEFLDSGPLTTSSTIDASEMKALKAIKNHDIMHFLKRRVGEKNLQKIHETITSPFADLPETDGTKATRSRKFCCWCVVTSFLFILVSVGALVGLAFAGIQIPLVTDLLFPPTQNLTDTVTNATVVNTTASTGIDQFAIAGQGFDSGEFGTFQSEVAVIDALMTTLNGRPVDITIEYVWPPEGERLVKIRTMFTEVYEYFGFVLEAVVVDNIEAVEWGAWKLRVRAFARAKYNQDLLMWFGFNERSIAEIYSEFCKKMDVYYKKVFVMLHNATMIHYTSYFGVSFIQESKRYFGKMKPRRPPSHIPDEWGNCTGSPVCP